MGNVFPAAHTGPRQTQQSVSLAAERIDHVVKLRTWPQITKAV